MPKTLEKLKEKWEKRFSRIEKYGEGLAGGYTGIIIVDHVKEDEIEYEEFHFMIPEEIYGHLPRRGAWKQLDLRSCVTVKADNIAEMMQIFEHEMKNPWHAMYGVFNEHLVFEFLNDLYCFFTYASDIKSDMLFDSY